VTWGVDWVTGVPAGWVTGVPAGWVTGVTVGWVTGVTAGWVTGVTAGWVTGVTAGWVTGVTLLKSVHLIFAQLYRRDLGEGSEQGLGLAHRRQEVQSCWPQTCHRRQKSLLRIS
jgi:hypothetical protein